MKTKNTANLTNHELRRLLNEIDQLDLDAIHPLSDEEVAELEASYEPPIFSTEREERHREQLEELRQEWLSDVEPFEGIFSRVDELAVSREEFAHRLRLPLNVLFKVDMHLIADVPVRFAHQLANALDVDIRSLYLYFGQAARTLDQVAASSTGKPAPGNAQTWEEAIKASEMPDEDKKYWLETMEG
jgi:hypothetical protein